MDKEEALMDSDFGSISNGEFLTPFDDGIHPTIEEDISETNPGETLNIQIGDEDNISEHGIYFIATSFTPCSYATSSFLLVSPTSPHLRCPTPSSFLFIKTLKGRLSMHMSIINIEDLVELILI